MGILFFSRCNTSLSTPGNSSAYINHDVKFRTAAILAALSVNESFMAKSQLNIALVILGGGGTDVSIYTFP